MHVGLAQGFAHAAGPLAVWLARLRCLVSVFPQVFAWAGMLVSGCLFSGRFSNSCDLQNKWPCFFKTAIRHACCRHFGTLGHYSGNHVNSRGPNLRAAAEPISETMGAAERAHSDNLEPTHAPSVTSSPVGGAGVGPPNWPPKMAATITVPIAG